MTKTLNKYQLDRLLTDNELQEKLKGRPAPRVKRQDIIDRIEVIKFDIIEETTTLCTKVTRDGWNGKGMFIYYVPAASYPASNNLLNTMQGKFPDDMVPYRSYLAMKTVQNDVVPWVASQSDILAEDWFIFEE